VASPEFSLSRWARPVGLSLMIGAWAVLGGLASPAHASGDALVEGERAYAHKEYAHAALYLRRAAENGSPVAQTYLGYMYQMGRGVPQDYAAAAGWFQLAAEQGEPEAQFLLGLLFDKGFGVPVDWVTAEVWLILAASHADEKDRVYWASVRDGIAQKLTLDQLHEAQRRAFTSVPVARFGAPPLSARF